MAEKKAVNAVIGFMAIALLSIAALAAAYVAIPRSPDYGQAQNASITMYYGTTCPHCKVVERFIEDNGLAATLPIEMKEVYEHEGNKTDLVETGGRCGLGSNIGIPLIYSADRCYVGEDECIAFLEGRAGIS